MRTDPSALTPVTGPSLTGPGRPALVVFGDRCDLPWLRLLRPGFRHCLVLLGGSGGWLAVEALSHRLRIEWMPGAPPSVTAARLRAAGLTVLAVRVGDPARVLAPVRPFSCVEVVKRVLGRRFPWAFTPWQLFCALKSEIKVDTGGEKGI